MSFSIDQKLVTLINRDSYNLFSYIVFLCIFFQYVNERLWRVATDNKMTVTTCALVENTGVEPVTSCVQGRRSSQLS